MTSPPTAPIPDAPSSSPSPEPAPHTVTLLSFSPGQPLIQLPSPARTRPPRHSDSNIPPNEHPRARWAARQRHPDGLPSRTLHLFRAPIYHADGTATWRLKCRPPVPVPLYQATPTLFVTQTQPTYVTLSDLKITNPLVVSALITVINPRDDGDPLLRRPKSGDRLLLPNETICRPWHVIARQLLLWFMNDPLSSLWHLPPTRPLPDRSCPSVADAPFHTSTVYLTHSPDILESYAEHQLEYGFIARANGDQLAGVYLFHEPPAFDPPVYPHCPASQ
ncbi:hypothetical protein K488DRAFT_91467 [Vararia minispora EC-137]|uniref:Uncharacterized protein n=1 Tax=Vararia minispora EC-137 TaxID=1314806 RepID=A0ACB8Q5M1_9AGAM|nr:hypothetical protein K488DRAFT_91467 [Vararia minispora EC-137]